MEDLENHFTQFKAVVDAYSETSKGNKELYGVIQILTKELETTRETERSLRELQLCKKSAQNESISVMYNKLKEKYEELLKRNKAFEQQVIDLENKFMLEKTEIVNNCKDKIAIYENELQKQQDHYKMRETQMNNDLQVHQASMALQIDDAECNWKSLLADANQKLKDSNNSCNTLRRELVALNNKIYSINSDADKRVQELQNKLAFTETQLRITQESLLNNQRTPIQKYVASHSRYYNTKSSYKLRKDMGVASTVEVTGDGQQGKHEPLCTTTHIGGQNNSTKNNQYYENVSVVNDLHKNDLNQKTDNSKVSLPPLKQLEDKNNLKNSGARKRKLYNPNDLDYLIGVEMDN